MILCRSVSLPEPTIELARLAEALALGAGETDALRLMQAFPQAIFLTDDAAARLVAEQLGYEAHGTIGVVIRTLRRGLRSKRQVINLIRSIPTRSTLFINRRLLDSIIDEIKTV